MTTIPHHRAQIIRDSTITSPMPPTAKEIKYDRQLRLWSANGQSALESSHLLLINASATGTEILKNLVLPGLPLVRPFSFVLQSSVFKVVERQFRRQDLR